MWFFRAVGAIESRQFYKEEEFTLISDYHFGISKRLPVEYIRFTQYWEKVQFRSYDEYLDQPYYIMKKLEWYRQAEAEGKERKEAQNK